MITKVEILRKIVHLATLMIPVGYALTTKKTVLSFLIPFFLAFFTVDLLRHLHPKMAALFRKYFFGRVLREEEKSTWMGASYFLFSTVLTIFLFSKSIAILSILILILSDTAAALTGKWIGRIQIFKKTLEGSLAFLFTSLFIIWIYPKSNHLFGSLAAIGATLIEILPIKVNDNLTIPLVAGTIMSFGM